MAAFETTRVDFFTLNKVLPVKSITSRIYNSGPDPGWLHTGIQRAELHGGMQKRDCGHEGRDTERNAHHSW